jgi:hypothetical protein
MLRFIASGLIATAIGLMVGVSLAVTAPAEEPSVSMFQRPDLTMPAVISASTTGVSSETT